LNDRRCAVMTQLHQRRVMRLAKYCAGVLLLGAAILVAARTPWGCGGPPPQVPSQMPVTYEGVPTIRVLLTPRGLDRAVLSATGGYAIMLDGKEVITSAGELAPTIVSKANPAWRIGDLTTEGQSLRLEPDQGAFAVLNQRAYRGCLELVAYGNTRLKVVNHLDMESYLAGVLAKELYPSWSLETFEAQAVAARTFAMYHVMTFGKSNSYDVGSNQSFQVYGGAAAETAKSWQAVRNTHGQVLTCGPAGQERVFMAQYSACCGGSVSPASAIRNAEDIEPLRGGQECISCAACPRYRWSPVRISKHHIYQALAGSYDSVAKLQTISTLKVAQADESGRIVWIDIYGGKAKSRPVRIRGEDLRVAMLKSGLGDARKLYSINCRLKDVGEAIEFRDGKGFGHGVGLCQWGAEGRAATGDSAEQILQFYYPGAKLLRAY